MSMAISLCLDVTVHDFMSLETSDIGEFLVINTKITKLFSVLEAINNFYKPGEHVLRFDEFGPDDMKRLVQSENITYAAIQKLYGMFPVDRKNISSVWGRIRLTKVVEKVDREAISPHGPDYTMRGHYAFTSLIIAAIKYQCNAFNNYAYSKSFVGSEGVVLNLDFASKMDLLWISDLSCLDSALIWLIALLNNHDVNIRACGLLSLTDLMQKYDIVSMLRVISVLTEKDTSDPKLKLSVKGLISMREKILMYLYTIVEYLLNSIERDKITDVDSIRCAIDFLLMYGGLITAERAKEQAPQDALDFQYSDTRLQTIMLSKAAESPASAAERGVHCLLLRSHLCFLIFI